MLLLSIEMVLGPPSDGVRRRRQAGRCGLIPSAATARHLLVPTSSYYVLVVFTSYVYIISKDQEATERLLLAKFVSCMHGFVVVLEFFNLLLNKAGTISC
jgi:hypothetical protein